MPVPTFRALLVEDNPADSYFVAKLLAGVRGPAEQLGRFEVDAVACLEQAIPLLKKHEHDVVMLDLSLPDSQGLETLTAVRDVGGDIPIVVLTGFSDFDLAVHALTLGAQDFLAKDNLGPEIITRTLRYSIERRRVQRALLRAIEEKEVLLRELHHRAKNNLQVISSLLGMQARRTDDARFQALVLAAQERIDTISLAHEQLHRAPDLARIDFSAYLSGLARAVHRTYDGDVRGIELVVEPGTFELPLDQAVSTGLVVNELLTNAFRHAFPEDRRGTVRVELHNDGPLFCLLVADDGVGLKDGALLPPRPLGLDIVATLAEQLDATLEHEGGPGTRFRLTFAVRENA